MSVFSFHLATITVESAFKYLFIPPKTKNITGLIHAEYMMSMTLGSPVFSPQRMLMRQVAFFAQWESEAAIELFLKNNQLGKTLAKGWHTRLIFLRQWGSIDGFVIPKEVRQLEDSETPVVAVTIARMRLTEVPRFIRWGRPVEKLVRDHPGASFAMAAIRLPQTVSTFSVWRSQKEMADMVHGHSAVPEPKRHSLAMKERERKDFHFQFTTLRFKPISEYGSWKGRTNIIPGLNH